MTKLLYLIADSRVVGITTRIAKSLVRQGGISSPETPDPHHDAPVAYWTYRTLERLRAEHEAAAPSGPSDPHAVTIDATCAFCHGPARSLAIQSLAVPNRVICERCFQRHDLLCSALGTLDLADCDCVARIPR